MKKRSGTDSRKQSLYIPEDLLQEVQHEAIRMDRSLSWIVQRCIRESIGSIRALPGVPDVAS